MKICKFILSIVLSLSLILTTACAGQPDTAQSTNVNADQTAETGETPEARTVTFACWWSEAEIATAKEYFDAEFTPETGITVEFKHVPKAGFQQQMISEISAGTAADLILASYDMIPTYYSNGLMTNISDLMERDSVDFTTFNNAEQWTFGGDMYGLPSEHPIFYFFVNKTMVEAAGYEVPYGSWTFEDLREIANACANPEENVYGLVDGMATVYPQGWYYLNGGREFNEDFTECTINSPNVVNAMEFVRELIYEDEVMPDPSIYASTSADQLFRDGKAAFSFRGTWVVNYLRNNDEEIDFEWDVIYAPTGPDATQEETWAWSAGLFIPTNAKDVETAWEVMKFWGSPEGIDNISIGALSTLPAADINVENEAYYTYPELPPENFNKDFVMGLFDRAVYAPTKVTMNDNVLNALASLADVAVQNKSAQEVCDAAYESIMSQWDTIQVLE